MNARHKIVRGRQAGRGASRSVRSRSVPVRRIPPSPWIGEIWRHMQPTAITDYESVQEAAWTSANLQAGYAFNFSTNTPVFGGEEWACYVHSIDVLASGDTIQSVVMQPLRFSIDEPAAADGGFEWWADDSLTEQQQLVPAPYAQPTVRGVYQIFASSTLLPSGGCHVSAGKPSIINFRFQGAACLAHAWNQYGGWSPTTAGQAFNQPAQWQVFARYLRFRKNGASTGPLYDLLDYQRNYRQSAPSVPSRRYDTGTIVFPSSNLWSLLGSAFENFELEFAAGDALEIDVWFQFDGVKQTTDRKVLACFSRYVTANSSRVGGGLSGWSVAPAVVQSYWPGMAYSVAIRGLKMADGLDPVQHTYTLTAADGVFAFGKAQQSGSISFSITSQRMVWAFSRTIGGGTEPGTGTSTWRSNNGEPWVLIANNCTGGSVPVEPVSDPPAPTDPPTLTNADGTCEITTPGRLVTITVRLHYDQEMAWMSAQFAYAASGSDPAATVLRYYRPQSSSDYVDRVNDRIEGTLLSGPTGVFNHLGSTVFELWQGAQLGTYDASDWGDAFADDIPTAITVTKVNQ